MPKYKVCKTGLRDYKTFDSLEDLIEWAQKENDKIKINDYVEVIDTGYCYTGISNGKWLELFKYKGYEDYIDILNHLNHKSLGYSDGIKSISKKDCIFNVVAEIDDKYIIDAINGRKYFDYCDGYYIMGKIGVKKVEKEDN